jgi:hypothetical protein
VTSIDIESGLRSINHSIVIAPSALARTIVSFPFVRILFDDNSPNARFFPLRSCRAAAADRHSLF